jgi:hypothetical protein
MAADEVLTRQCPCLRAFDSWSICGRWRIWRLRTERECTREFTQIRPPEGKDLHPACLILYCWHSWSCYNGAQMRSGGGGGRWRVLAYARGIYARSEIDSPSWPPLLALIWGARSQNLVQVGYRCMRTLISLGLRMSIMFLGCSRYANDEDSRVVPLSAAVRIYFLEISVKPMHVCAKFNKWAGFHNLFNFIFFWKRRFEATSVEAWLQNFRRTNRRPQNGPFGVLRAIIL